MKHKKKKNLSLSKVAIAKINLRTIDIIKGGTLPTSDEQGCQMSDAPDENGICFALK